MTGEIFFYSCAGIAVLTALLAITRRNPMHAILYLVVMLLAIAGLFFQLGAPFLAALQVIVYAGAIVVLFLFVIMMINPDNKEDPQESRRMKLSWFGPLVLVLILGIEWFFLLQGPAAPILLTSVGPAQLATTLFENYSIGLQLVALFLLVGLLGAYHLGSHRES